MFSGVVHDRPEFSKFLLLFVSFLLMKENTPRLVAFEISFPFENNILDIKDEEMLQWTMLSLWLVWFFALFLGCLCSVLL